MKIIIEMVYVDGPDVDRNTDRCINMYKWQEDLACLLARAAADGVVLTVATQSKQPQAMGNYDLVVSARVKRGS